MLQCCAPCRQERQRETQEAVESKFLEHAGVQHRGGRGRGGVGFRSPGVKRKERNENAETDQQQQEDVALRVGAGSVAAAVLQRAEIKGARGLGHAAIKHDQAEQQNETAGREIDRDFPRRGLPVAAAPDSDEQKSRDQRELVKGVEEKEIERSECADGAAGNEEEAGVEGVFVLRDFAGEPDGRERDDRGEEQHHQAQTIDAESEIDPPIAADRTRGDELKTALARFEAGEYASAVAASVERRRPRARFAGRARRAESRARPQSGRKTMKSKHQRKSVK